MCQIERSEKPPFRQISAVVQTNSATSEETADTSKSEYAGAVAKGNNITIKA